jgi:long-chain fatty acid transport protein
LLVRPIQEWNIEVDAVWTGWSSIDTVVVAFDNGLPPDSTDFSWDNSMTYNIGTEYHLSAPVVIRAGYSYDTTPVPSQTVSPILPDGDRQWFSLRWLSCPRGVDLGYHLIRLEREKNSVGIFGHPNNTANGTYRTWPIRWLSV